MSRFCFAIALCAAFAPLIVRAAELPQRAPGLWETKALFNGRYRVLRRCFRDGERSAFLETYGIDACTRFAQKTPAGFMAQAECRTRGLTLNGRMQIAGDFGAELNGRVRTSVTRDDGSAPPDLNTMTFTSRLIGPCGLPGR